MQYGFLSIWDGYLRCIAAAKHRNELLDNHTKPVHSVLLRADPETREFENVEIDKMLGQEVIEPIQTKWVAPVVCAPKKDGNFPVRVDYRKLDTVTNHDEYRISRVDECIDSIGVAEIVLTIDANIGYWHIEIEKSGQNKTAFTSCHKLYWFICMPAGLQNAREAFQRTTNVIIATVRSQFPLVVLEDIAIASTKPEEHIRFIRVVRTLQKDSIVILKPQQCESFT